jgi:GNAT superfamily N-acetyltransferase
MKASAPRRMTQAQDVSTFSSGDLSYDSWLKNCRLPSSTSPNAHTFASTYRSRVVGYYTVSVAVVAVVDPAFVVGATDCIPVVVLNRLAVDKTCQGRGLGRALFRDCAMRVSRAGDTVGAKGLLAYAVSERRKRFCSAVGLVESPFDPMILMVTLKSIRRMVKLAPVARLATTTSAHITPKHHSERDLRHL